jgi:hypothetical protein
MSLSSYSFEKMGRIGLDATDSSQRNLANTRFANYMLSDYSSSNLFNSHIDFATQQPNVMFSSHAHGNGLNGSVVDIDSYLVLGGAASQRPLEKLQLMQRPFLTVPYLGRGSCNPTLESQLLQGEIVHDKKSVNTVMEKSFSDYTTYVNHQDMSTRTSDARYTVEEAAMDGWVRGGVASRDMSADSALKQTHRATDRSF